MLSRRVAWAVAISATLTMTVSYVDRVTLGALGISVSKDLAISETAYGWLGSAFSIAYLLATPLSGWWIDRIGARRGLVVSILLWTSVAALHAVVPGFGALFALRIALGIAEGPSFPGAAQTIERILPPADRARGFGVLFTGSSIGTMLTPPLASYLYSVGGWRFAFLGTALVGLLWVPLWIAWTRRKDVRAKLDTAQSAKPERTMTAREMLRQPAIIRGLCAIFATAPIVGVAIHWGAKFLGATFGVKQADVGHYLWLPPLVFDLGAILFGDLVSRGGRPRVLFAIGALFGTCLMLLPLAGTAWQAVVIVAVAMAGCGIVYTLATAEVLSRMPRENISLASGIMAGAQSLSLIIIGPLVGAMIDHFGNYDVAVISVGAWVIPGCIVWLVYVTPAPSVDLPRARARGK